MNKGAKIALNHDYDCSADGFRSPELQVLCLMNSGENGGSVMGLNAVSAIAVNITLIFPS